jgi:hypothetical protein
VPRREEKGKTNDKACACVLVAVCRPQLAEDKRRRLTQIVTRNSAKDGQHHSLPDSVHVLLNHTWP